MSTLHSQLLEQAVEQYSADLAPLRGARIFVTGSSGFLSASLLVFLDRLNNRHGLDLHLAASARRPASSVAHFRFLGTAPRIDWHVAPVENTVLPEGRWIVVHAASFGSPKDYLREPLATYSANVEGLTHLFRQHKRIRELVFFSSAEIYGQASAANIPTPEDYVGGLPTLSPRSIYGESKRMAEVLGTCLSVEHGTPLTVLRPWNIYGPGQRLNDGRVPIEFVRQAKEDGRITLSSDGSPTRSFCYVWDAISQIVSTLGRAEKQNVYNIGNGSAEISILDLAKTTARVCKLPDGAVSFNTSSPCTALQRCAPDVERVNALSKFRSAPAAIETGIRTLVEWHNFLSHHA